MPYVMVPSWLTTMAVLYPLDEVTGALGGWATRKIRAAYAGSCLRVRRSSDDAEQDIGFVGALLDTTSLLSFVGANDGFVVTWYDQSGAGAGRDFANATKTAQPKIVSSGSLITTLGGQPSIDFDGSSDVLKTTSLASAFLTTSAGTVLAVFQADAINTSNANAYDNDAVWCNDDGQVGVGLHSTGPKTQAFNQDAGALDDSEITIATGTAYVHVWQHDSGNVESYLNNNTAQDVTTSGNTTALNTTLVIGANYAEVAFFDGQMTMLIAYNTALSDADIDLVGAAMAAPYSGLTWS